MPSPVRIAACWCVLVTLANSMALADPVAERLGEGIVRFHRDANARDAAESSFALQRAFEPLGPAPAGFLVTPVFGSGDGLVTVSIGIEPGTSLYGTGEIAGPLLRNGRRSETWNTDAYGYTDASPSLYQSHPWVLAVRADGTAFGVLADTTWRCEIDLRGSGDNGGIRFAAAGPVFPVIVIDRDSPQAVLKGLAELVGTMPLPPLWALGYHQCRYSYNPESRVREIAAGFRDRKIPADVIWFDIDYMNEYRVFTFDKGQFPDPKGLNGDLHAMGFRTIWMIDPGVKAEKGYFVHDQMMDGDHAVKKADGSVYKGEVWPGFCVFPDYTDPAVREWWAGLYKDFMAQGIDGVWNDMNEPAVFNVPTKTMPEDNLHRGGDPGVSSGPHARFHNIYGTLMAKGTFDGIQAANPGKRPFVLTRAGFLGSHRYAATWTGDNAAEWDDLEQSIPMTLNLGLSGQPFCGPDVGGFIGNGPADPEERRTFYARWFGFGSLLPFSRGHTGKGNIDKEPWAFGPETEATIKRALERRYRLIPYYYTLFEEASTSGLPVARPVFFADPADPALRSEDDSFLIGADLLVVAPVTPLADRVSAMPRGLWRQVEIVGDAGNPDLPRLFIRGGAIVPLGPVEEYTAQRPLDPLTLLVSLDENGRAEGTLYEDAGDGFAYRGGDFLRTRYSAQIIDDAVRVEVSHAEGRMQRPDRPIFVEVILGNGRKVVAEGKDGTAVLVPLAGAAGTRE